VSGTVSADHLEDTAKQAYQSQQWTEAGQGFEAARRAYETAGDELKAAEMANNACVAFLQAGEAKRALESVEGTQAIFDRLQAPHRAAQAMGNLASALEGCGRSEDAERAYADAAERFKALGDDEARADTLKALSQLQLKRGRAVDALTSMQIGLEGSRRLGARERFLRWLARIPMRIMGG
jgi:tetratricopeptide (TPR) repeat protein